MLKPYLFHAARHGLEVLRDAPLRQGMPVLGLSVLGFGF